MQSQKWRQTLLLKGPAGDVRSTQSETEREEARGIPRLLQEDAEQVVQLLQEEPRDRCPFKNLVEDAQILLRGCDCSVQHVWKEGNLCADFLAKMGAKKWEPINPKKYW